MPYPYFDTMIAEYLLYSSDRRYKLDDLALKYFDYKMISYEEVAGKGKDQKSFQHIDVNTATQYAAEDAEITFSLEQILRKALEEQNLLELFETIEMPLLPVLQDMEKNGIKLDTALLSRLSKEAHESMVQLEKEIIELAGETFNLNSTKQLQVILFEKMKLPIKKKTKTGISTDVEVLELLSEEYEIARKLLDYRQFQKLTSTYIDSLPLLISKKTNRIHTSFNQTIASTGRLSSTNPNLQNIPIRNEWGKKIREAFIAEPGKVFLSADYSQIELRIFAHIAQDQSMIEAFRSGLDIHASTASKVFHISQEQVTQDQRRYAKTINFGLMYGMGPFKLSKQLGISMDEARGFIDEYFLAFSSIRACIDRIIEETKQKGYIETLFGRKRSIPEILSMNRTIEEAGKREAVNAVIQGTAADIIKIAMIRLHEKLRQEKCETKLLLQIHDELLFECPQHEIEKVTPLIKETMESVMELSVPLIVEVCEGKNWREAHE